MGDFPAECVHVIPASSKPGQETLVSEEPGKVELCGGKDNRFSGRRKGSFEGGHPKKIYV